MVELAPHLVYPTPFLVPSLGEDPKNRMLGIGLNMYDVMATTRVGSGRRERRRETALRGEGSETRAAARAVGARPASHDPRRGGGGADPGAGAAEAARGLPLLRLPDRRRAARADGPRRGRAVRSGAAERSRGRRPDRGGRSRGRRGLRGSRVRRALRGPCRERRQCDRRVGGPAQAGRDPRRGRDPADLAEPRHARDRVVRRPGHRARGLRRAGGRGSQDLRPALVRPDPDRHHGPRLRRRHRPRRALG